MTAKYPNQAVSARTAHSAHSLAAGLRKAVSQPHGNYPHDALMLGTIYAIHGWTIDGLPPSVDVHPNGAQNLSDVSDIALMKSVQYLESYWPVIGDVVVMVTQPMGKSRSLRYVIGAVDGSASPYPRPLGHIDSVGRWVQGPGSLWGGPGAPTIPLADPSASPPIQGAVNGDWYLQFDEPVAWAMIGGVWTLSYGVATTTTQAGTNYALEPTDAGTIIQFTNTAGCQVALGEYFPIGCVIELIRQGGPVLIYPVGTAPTIQSPGGLAIANQYGIVTLRQVALNVWQLTGDVTPVKQVTTVTTGGYSVTPTDIGSLIVIDFATAASVGIASTLDVPIGAWIDVCQLGAGSVSVSNPGGGVTLLSPTGTYSARAQYSTIRATQIALNEWVLSGDLS